MTATDMTRSLAVYRAALIRSPLLDAQPAIRHGITGRLPQVAPAEANLGYSGARDRDAAWRERQRWARAAGIDPFAISSAHQVHGRDTIAVGIDRRGRGGPLGSESLGRADALVTATPGVAVMTLHADCLPIIIADPELPAVGVIHAGWRGTVADVVGAAVAAMRTELGARPERMVALFGPGIRACCYEVGDEVVAAWRAIGEDDAEAALQRGPRRHHFDLARANLLLLERVGVASDRIDDQAHCTSCNGDRWFSHRLQGPDTGRFGALAGIAPDNAEEAESWA